MLKADGYCLFDADEFKAIELAGDEGAIIIYQFIASSNLGKRTVYPLGLKADATYEVQGEKRSGADIMEQGVLLDCKEFQHWKWRAAMVEIKKLS